MKVLIITREFPPYTKGGMSNFVFQVVSESKKQGIDITVIANHPGTGTYKDQQDGVDIYRVPWGGSTFLTQIPVFSFFASRLARKIQDEYDLIYSNYTPLFGRFDKPFIVGFQATRLGEYRACSEAGKYFQAFLNKIYIPFDKSLIKKAKAIIALSENMVEELVTTNNRGTHIEIIPNGVDEKLFYPLSLRRFENPAREILYIGRLDSRKNVRILFKALKNIKTKINARLTLVGTGREYSYLKKLATHWNLNVQFKGHMEQSNLTEIYNRADLFVLPSLYEGLPLVALEAMACATPTIISDGSPDIGVPRFKRDDYLDLSNMLLELLSSDSRLNHLSTISYQISRNFRWEDIVNKFFKLIKSYVKQPSTSAN